ncbi:unnamed protein product [Chrysodeixis includens]|uniref:Uncharacterized protein n=1 Tax=Chrysodeixis includens TaxID=689277 RepID=A0A9P0BX36_CHRIL|nr:unnamed protein product [Chrysodeixis includens]
MDGSYHVEEDDLDLSDTESSSSSNPGIFEVHQPFVLELHDIRADDPTSPDTNLQVPGKMKKHKKKKKGLLVRVESHSSISSDSLSESSNVAPLGPKEQFYDAHQSFHGIENQPPTTLAPAAIPPTAVSPTAEPPPTVIAPAVPTTALPPAELPPTALPPRTLSPKAVSPTAVPLPIVISPAVPPTALPSVELPPTTLPPTTLPPTALPPTALPPTTLPPTTLPPMTLPPTTLPPTTLPPTVIPPTLTPSAVIAPAQLQEPSVASERPKTAAPSLGGVSEQTMTTATTVSTTKKEPSTISVSLYVLLLHDGNMGQKYTSRWLIPEPAKYDDVLSYSVWFFFAKYIHLFLHRFGEIF